VHAGYDWCGAALDRLEHVGQAQGVRDVLLARVRGHRAHPGEVGPRAKALASPGERHGPDVAVGRHAIEHRGQLRDHPGVEGVARLRPVERDMQNGTLLLDQEMLVRLNCIIHVN